jgi:splicing factor 45
LAEGEADTALIQEPWIYREQVRGLTNSVAPQNNSRSCIYIRNHINALPLLEFCSRDATRVRVTYTYRGSSKELTVASAYLSYDADEPPPTREVRDIINYCHSRKKQLIMGCDANAHHTLWGSTGNNPRGECFMKFLVSSNLNVLNHDNKPTFVVCNRKVIDLH